MAHAARADTETETHGEVVGELLISNPRPATPHPCSAMHAAAAGVSACCTATHVIYVPEPIHTWVLLLRTHCHSATLLWW